MLAEADRRYVYNAVGEPVQIEGNSRRRLTYDPLGQVAQVEDDGREIARYRHNQNRQRIAKTVNGQTTLYLWQGGAIAAEANAQGTIKARYIYMGSRPVAMIQYDDGNKPKLYAIHTDQLGTPLQVTDADRKIVWQAEYDIYGRASVRHHSLHSGASPPNRAGLIATAHASAPASFDFNLRLPGQYEDAETGWHYNFHRYYNPETGRYLTPDPIGLEGGTNLYNYVDGSPAGASDSLGLYTVYWGGAGLDGDYIQSQINELENAGLVNVVRGTGSSGMYRDAIRVNSLRYLGSGPQSFDADPESKKAMCPEQTNYIGYSYGSLTAAHTALYWARQGRTIDNLVLVGSPIDQGFLNDLRANTNIKNILIYDLTLYGDSIHAGMTQTELLLSAPMLALQIAQNPRTGHFYYNPTDSGTDPLGIDRRKALAENMARNGLR